MNSVFIISSVFTLTALLFSGSSGILPKSYATINKVLPDNFFELDKQNVLDKELDSSQFMQAGQYLMNGLNDGVIDEGWLQANGLNEDLLYGIETNQLMETTEHLMNGLNNGEIDQDWIEEYLTSDNDGGGYAGGFVLILVLFILLVIIGSGFGGGG